MQHIAKLILILTLTGSAVAVASENARYRVTFEADWSAATHPVSFPSNPHFSGLIGATHNEDAVLWRSDESASRGIEQMAETGGKSLLQSEINNLVDGDLAEFLLSGGGIENSPGSVSLEFDISRSHSLVSLVSMIAPSPDWFVGVDSLPLREAGTWIDELTVDLQAYDSGTDSGPDYQSPNADTQPPQPIFHIDQAPFQDQVPLGRFVFELLSESGNLPFEGSLSGLYHDPTRVGEGINLLVSQIGDRHFMFVTWYTYDNGEAMWLAGNRDFNVGDEVIVIELLRASGTGFGPDFVQSEVELIPWGTIELTFPACGILQVVYSSLLPGFGSSTITLEQLVSIADTFCQ